MSDGLLLALDAADSTGTAALLRDGALIAEEAVAMRAGPDDAYFPAILALFAGAGVSPRDLAAVACGAGPGSFTSLRVAGALAKGLAVGGGIPLYGVPSLALLVAASDATRAPGSRWLASLDALRGDRYLALVTIGPDGAVSTVEGLGLAPAGRVAERAGELGATTIGPDEMVVAHPHARGIARCLALVAAAGPVEVAGWEPAYGRLAEAQVKWEAEHGRALGTGASAVGPGHPGVEG